MPGALHYRDSSFQKAKARVDLGQEDYDDSDVELLEMSDHFGPNLTSVEMKPLPPMPASWRTMPHKGQLAILSLSRFADFFQLASLQAIMFYQLKSFDNGASDAAISWQAGVLQGGFTAAQIVSAILLGRMADAPWSGRKRVLLLGFVGTGISCVGVAFARSFMTAVLWRVMAGGVNGTVGAARTMVAETVEKKFHSRAFVLLPLAFNVANILGPILGGLFAQPLVSLPSIFGPDSLFGGKNGVSWMRTYPYAAPNLLSALILFIEAAIIYFGLHETLESRRFARDNGLEIAATLKRCLPGQRGKPIGYTSLNEAGTNGRSNHSTIFEADDETDQDGKQTTPSMKKPVLPFSRIWTRNVVLTMLSTALFHFHLGAFTSLWLVFLSATRYDPSNTAHPPHLPFVFTGGLSFPPITVGFAMAILGVIGVILQLVLYPPISARLGLIRSLRLFLGLFPIAYCLAPYLALIPSTAAFALWLGICLVLLLQVTAQTFALPATIILLNNCSPHKSVLGSVHGIGQSVVALSKTVGSVLAGRWFATGLETGVVGTAWWSVAAVSVLGWGASWLVEDGSGKEIFLPGEEGSGRGERR